MAHGILAATRRSKRARCVGHDLDPDKIELRDDHAEARRRLEAGVKCRRRLSGAPA